MKSLLPAATAVFLATTAALSPPSAATPFAANSAGITTGIPHYEWQYHYGKKARSKGAGC